MVRHDCPADVICYMEGRAESEIITLPQQVTGLSHLGTLGNRAAPRRARGSTSRGGRERLHGIDAMPVDLRRPLWGEIGADGGVGTSTVSG
jgi:hypothetical protein